MFVELVDSTSNGLLIEVIDQNTACQFLAPLSRIGKDTARTLLESNDGRLGDSYTYARMLPKCFPSKCNTMKDHQWWLPTFFLKVLILKYAFPTVQGSCRFYYDHLRLRAQPLSLWAWSSPQKCLVYLYVITCTFNYHMTYSFLRYLAEQFYTSHSTNSTLEFLMNNLLRVS